MQAGKIEVVPQCAVCGANLSSDRARTCGKECRRVLKVREKIAARVHPCNADCPSWAVFDNGREINIERCDECWRGVEDAPRDEDFAALPEAQEELQLTWSDGDHYVYPVYGPSCDNCGSFGPYGLWRRAGDALRCVSCGDERPLRQADVVALLRRAHAALCEMCEVGEPDMGRADALDHVGSALRSLGEKLEELCPTR